MSTRDDDRILEGITEATDVAEAEEHADDICEHYSRFGDGWESDDQTKWHVLAVHPGGGFVVVALANEEVLRHNVAMSSYTATKFARDILAVAAHVEDVEDEDRTDEWERLAAIAEERGWYTRWDREGGVLGFREDGTAQPGRWVECDKDHPDALPDVERVQRELS